MCIETYLCVNIFSICRNMTIKNMALYFFHYQQPKYYHVFCGLRAKHIYMDPSECGATLDKEGEQ